MVISRAIDSGGVFKKVYAIIAALVLFTFSFIFFLYLSFPYGVLKETISANVLSATGMNLRMQEFSPAFPLGVAATNVEISSPNASAKALHFKSIKAKLSILDLFLFRLGANILAESQTGTVDLSFTLPFGRLLAQDFTPSSLDFEAVNFGLDEAVSYGLAVASANGVGGAVAGPLLAAIGFRGKLTGTASLSLNPTSPTESTGTVKLALRDAALILSDPSLGLPDQVFKTAQVNSVISNGVVKIEPTTRFSAEELDFSFEESKIMLKNPIMTSVLDVKFGVKLSGGLQEKFGWVLDAATGGSAKDGGVKFLVSGTLDAPTPNPQ
jgi:type II secretion system protein N